MADYTNISAEEQQRLVIHRLLQQLHVALPAQVQEFDAASQKATVQPSVKMKVTLGDEVTFKALPLVTGVPVIIPYAQTAGLMLTLPVKAGDTGLLIVPDKGMDLFLQSNGEPTAAPFGGDKLTSAARSHNLTDAIFIPGLSVNSAAIASYSTDNIELRDKERKQYISLGPNGIVMTDGTGTLTMQEGVFSVKTPKTANITSKNMTLNGSSNAFQGNVVSMSGTFIDSSGVVLSSHTHSGVQTGSGTTAVPNGGSDLNGGAAGGGGITDSGKTVKTFYLHGSGTTIGSEEPVQVSTLSLDWIAPLKSTFPLATMLPYWTYLGFDTAFENFIKWIGPADSNTLYVFVGASLGGLLSAQLCAYYGGCWIGIRPATPDALRRLWENGNLSNLQGHTITEDAMYSFIDAAEQGYNPLPGLSMFNGAQNVGSTDDMVTPLDCQTYWGDYVKTFVVESGHSEFASVDVDPASAAYKTYLYIFG